MVLLVVPSLLEMVLRDYPARNVFVRLRLLRKPQLPAEGLIGGHDKMAFFQGQKVKSI